METQEPRAAPDDLILETSTTYNELDPSTWDRNQEDLFFETGFQSKICWGQYKILISAEDIQESRSGNGLKAYVKLGTPANGGTWFSHSQIHISRQTERNSLVNAADKKAENLSIDLPSKQLLSWVLDNWALGFRDKWASRYDAEALLVVPQERPKRVGLLEPFLGGGGHILMGPPESAKSWVGMLMAASLESGTEHLWPLPGGKRRCIWVNLERSPDSVMHRAHGVNTALGLSPFAPVRLMHHRHAGGITTLKNRLAAAIRREKAEVVFVDSISRLSGGGTLNDDQIANQIIDHLNSLGVTWVGLAHTPKDNNNSVFGSQHFTAGADLIFSSKLVRVDEQNLACGLRIMKASDQARFHGYVHAIRLQFGNDRLIAAWKDSPHRYPELGDAADASGARDLAAEIRRLLADGPATVMDIAKACEVHRATIYRRLDSDASFVKLPEKVGKDRLYGLATTRHE